MTTARINVLAAVLGLACLTPLFEPAEITYGLSAAGRVW